MAVDGSRGTDHLQERCTQTGENDTNPWWRVDLLTVYTITSVRMLNRGIDAWGGKGQSGENKVGVQGDDFAKSEYRRWTRHGPPNFAVNAKNLYKIVEI